KARDFIDRAVAVYRKYPPSRDFVDALTSAAYVRITRRDWLIARSRLEEAIAVLEKPNGVAATDLLSNLYTYLGAVEHRLDDLPAADRDLGKGLELARAQNGDDHIETIFDMTAYANLLVA